jgi:hypothetical protein
MKESKPLCQGTSGGGPVCFDRTRFERSDIVGAAFAERPAGALFRAPVRHLTRIPPVRIDPSYSNLSSQPRNLR